jgi:hypothetical protein
LNAPITPQANGNGATSFRSRNIGRLPAITDVRGMGSDRGGNSPDRRSNMSGSPPRRILSNAGSAMALTPIGVRNAALQEARNNSTMQFRRNVIESNSPVRNLRISAFD